MNCVVPANQPIVLALLNMAKKYRNLTYVSSLYNDAAEIISEHHNDIYDECILGKWHSNDLLVKHDITDASKEFIEDFINQYIKKHPRPQENLMPLRRSPRLANKPKVIYFTQEDELDEERDEVTKTIKMVCSKKGWEYSDDLVTDFYDWLPTANTYYLPKYDPRVGKDKRAGTIAVAKDWTLNISAKLGTQKYKLHWKKFVLKCCNKNDVEYNDILLDRYLEWFKAKGYYDTCTSTVNEWFSTLKKPIVF